MDKDNNEESQKQPPDSVSSQISTKTDKIDVNKNEFTKNSEVKLLSGLQKAGLTLVNSVGLVISAISVTIFIVAFLPIPQQPELPALSSPASKPNPGTSPDPGLTVYETNVAQYVLLMKTYNDTRMQQVERAKDLFQIFVTGSFIPILTTILGYVFGSRKETD